MSLATVKPRVRVIVDNDFSGDPDDLYQLAHHVLSPSVEIPFVIGSHLRVGDGFDPSDVQAENAVRVARGLLDLIGSSIPVVQGSNVGLADAVTPIDTPAARAIIAEALRDDTELPLVVAVGGGLTEIASALLLEPAIADRLTVVWIGGPEYPGRPKPPGIDGSEYNLRIDIPSAQAVFASSVALHQFPRDAYRQALVSLAELDLRVRPHGELGHRLVTAIDQLSDKLAGFGFLGGETYCLGDSPLVLVTALTTTFEPDAASSAWELRPAPSITDDGEYGPVPEGAREIRVYTRVDTRLMFEDFFLKLERWAASRP